MLKLSLALIPLCTIFISFHISSTSATIGLIEACATIYSHNGYSGLNHTIRSSSHISNLEEEYFHDAHESWSDSATASISVVTNCTVSACPKEYFGGPCQVFNQSVSSFPESTSIKSLKCHCFKECQNSQARVRRPACAIAYLDSECELYVEFKGRHPSFSEETAAKLSKINVRDGCTLSIYDEVEYEGEITLIDNDTQAIEEGWGERLKSYECDCPSDELQLIPLQDFSRPEHYPVPINIPDNIDDISRLINGNYTGHPGLAAALKSIKHKRSPHNAYILVLGSTGSGKSTLINLLFNNENLTLSGDGGSTTSSILEFRVPVPLDELGVTNSEIRIIDTPGLGDTGGLEQDARFLATLDKYLSTHQDLSHRIPNAVFILHPFQDNRFEGPGSNFIKMLRRIDSFRNRITDESYSNVIFVLTHFSFATKHFLRNPQARIQDFKKVIEDYCLFPKPISIVLAESKGKDQNLNMKNGNYLLPSGDLYPQNLIERMKIAMTNGGDLMGRAIIDKALNPDYLQHDSFNFSTSEYNLLPSTSDQAAHNGTILKYLNILIASELDIETTEVSTLLSEAYETLNDSDLKRKFPGSLVYLQKALNVRGIQNITQIPKTTLSIVNLFSTLKINSLIENLLEKGLSLKAPPFKDEFLVGKSYNVLMDVPLTSVSSLEEGELKSPSTIGYVFPTTLSCQASPSERDRFKIFSNRKAYLEYRKNILGVDERIKEEAFVGAISVGFNIISDNGNLLGQNQQVTFSALREYRIFQLRLNDDVKVTSTFREALHNLKPFNETNYENVQQWKAFFLQYGTHIIHSVHGGGSIEIKATSNYSSYQNVSKRIFDFVDFAEKIELSRSEGQTSGEMNLNGIEHSLTFRGGDPSYKTTDLTKMSVQEASSLLNNWKKSLRLRPEVLWSSVTLRPLSHIVNKGIGQDASSKIAEGAKRFLDGTLEYTPSKILLAELDTCKKQKLMAVENFNNQTAIINADMEKVTDQIANIRTTMSEDSATFIRDLLVLQGEETRLKAISSLKDRLLEKRSSCEKHKI